MRQQSADRLQPAVFDTAQGGQVAVWTSSWGAPKALRGLLAPDAIVDLGGNGYPSRMTARAASLLGALRRGGAPAPEIGGGKVTFYDDAIGDCDDDEWLIIELWDRS